MCVVIPAPSCHSLAGGNPVCKASAIGGLARRFPIAELKEAANAHIFIEDLDCYIL